MSDTGWQDLPLHRIKTGSLYKIVLIGCMAFWSAIGLLLGVSAFFGFDTVEWNDEPATGLLGLVVGLVIGAAFGLISAGFFGLSTHIGVRLYCRFKPDTSIKFSVQ